MRVSSRTACAAFLLLLSVAVSVAQTAPPATAPAPAAPSPEMEKPSADASTGQVIELTVRAALRRRGQSTWDDGFSELKKATAALEAEAKRLGLAVAGPPLAHFVDSDDMGFTYEAFLPLAGAPAPGLGLEGGVTTGETPPGRAMLFTHEGAYDEIDAAYEAITAFLEEKGLAFTGKFLEEYLALPEKSDEPGMKLNIYVFLR